MTLRLSSRPWRFFSIATEHTERVALLAAVLAAWAAAVPLENWRFPYYRIAAERDEIRSSASGLFWDDLGAAATFDSSLWPDTALYGTNHFAAEPAFELGLANEPFATGKKSNLRGNLLTDFRFGKLSVRNALDVDQGYQSDSTYPWHTERFAAGRIEEAYAQFSGRYGFARLGRMNRCWGPFPDRSIFLSNNPFSYDGFEWQFNVPFLEFRHLFAAFPQVFGGGADAADAKTNRYLTAHALNFIVGKWLSAGVVESVVFARDGGFPDMQYINPVSVYTVINTNHEGRGNLMLGFQALAHPFTEKVTLKGQVLFDDFQVDAETAGDREPTHWALDVGGYVKDFTPIPLKHHAGVEYHYLSKWIYTVNQGNTDRGERYIYRGKSLGYPTIDGDGFRGAVTLIGNNYWAATVGAGIARQDTNTVATPWPDDTALHGALGYTDEDPLSGRDNVEQTVSVFFQMHGHFRDFASAHLGVDNRWIRNKENTGDNETLYDPRVVFRLTLHYSDFFLTFGK
ncbi:MAG: hypothetical protein GF418_11510 [Chitinivibrionales bacterium]|nr:hypothetical protein [Chitinivibrionales bacterium]MBD3396242.1 hypothetical protein [Chitinivibrionales bacterium]